MGTDPSRASHRWKRRFGRAGLRLVATPTAAAALLVAVAVGASAHVTVQPEVVEGGGFSVVAFRVPNERDDATTTKVRVILPEDQPIAFVQTTSVPGWKVTTALRTLAEPIEVFGEQVNEVVAEVIWTATAQGIEQAQFQDFEVSLGPLPTSGEMVFKALQTYSDGEQVNWNQVGVNAEVELEFPAPVLTLTAPSSESSTAPTVTAETTQGAADDGAIPDEDSDDSSSSILAMSLAGGALAVSLAALFFAFRRRTA